MFDHRLSDTTKSGPALLCQIGRTGAYVLLSILVHALVLGLAWLGSSVEHDRASPRFKLPAEAEFGVLNGVSEPAQSASPPPAPPPKLAEKPKQQKKPKPRSC